MKRFSYGMLAVALGITAAIWVPKLTRKPKDPPPQEKERQAEAAGSASPLNTARAVTISAAARARVGIRITALTATSAQKRIEAPAIVLSAQSLAAARNAYVAAQANLGKARVNLGVARKEYARVKLLYRDNQNVSEKDFQSAQGAFDADAIDLRSAREQLDLQTSLVRQNWGTAVAKWVKGPSPALDQVLARKETLVEVSLPDGETVPPPSTLWLAVPGGKRRRASYVSPLPRVDPRVQGISLLYLTAALPGLAPGVTLTAQLPVGRRMRGVVVPASAVVWSNGEAWVYGETASGSFLRRPVATDFRMNGGYFVTQGFSPGQKIVVSGAQILLSEEFSGSASSAGEGDEDDD